MMQGLSTGCRPWSFTVVAGVALAVGACAGPAAHQSGTKLQSSFIEPADERERALLSALRSIEPGGAHRIDGVEAMAEAAYSAASGRTCRGVVFADGESSIRRLACSEGHGWFFVPDVFLSRDASRGQ